MPYPFYWDLALLLLLLALLPALRGVLLFMLLLARSAVATVPWQEEPLPFHKLQRQQACSCCSHCPALHEVKACCAVLGCQHGTHCGLTTPSIQLAGGNCSNVLV
jgi:hypothetical protein